MNKRTIEIPTRLDDGNGSILYVHPGLPKTAGSFLKRYVFAQLESRGVSVNDPLVVQAERAIAFPEKVTTAQSLADVIDEMGATRTILSYDALCGDPYASFRNHKVILERLSASSSGLKVKVLMVVRRQADWIESIFRQSLHEYYFKPFRKFVVWPGDTVAQGYPSIDVVAMNWHSLARGFAEVFGESAVTVLPYEMLVREPEEFLVRLSHYFETPLEPAEMDVQVNRGYGSASIRLALLLNPLLHEKSRFGFLPNRPFFHALKARRHRPVFARLFRASAGLSLRRFLQNTVDRYFWSPPCLFEPSERKRVMEICAEGNCRLAEYCPVELSTFGYVAKANEVDDSLPPQTRVRP